MELFKLVGKIAVDNTEAERNINSVTAQSKKIGDGFQESSVKTGRSLAEIAAANGKTVNEVRSEASKIAAEYRNQGMDASSAMKKAYSDIGFEAGSASKKITDDAKNAENGFKSAFSSIGSSAAALGKGTLAVGAAMGGAFIAVTEGTREYRQEMGLLESAYQTAGLSSKAAKDTYSDLNAVMRDSGAAVEASQHLALIADNEDELKDATHTLTGVYAKFGDSLPLEGLAEGINHTASLGEVQGSLADALEWSGITVDEFNAQLATCSSEEERQDLIMKTLRDTYSKAADQYKETNKDVMDAEKAQEKLSDAFAEVGKVCEPIMTNIKNKVADMVSAAAPKIEELIDKIKDASKWVKDNEDKINAWVGIILGATVAVGTFLLILNWGTIMTAAASAINKVRTAILLMNAAMLANPIGIVIAILAGLTAAFIYLWNTCEPFRKFWIDLWELIQKKTKEAVEAVKKWWKNMSDDMKEKFAEMKQKATEIFENIKQTISSKVQAAKDLASAAFMKLKANIISPIIEAKNKVVEVFGNIYSTIKGKIDSAKEAVKGAVDKIKGFFDIDLKFKAVKMPKISISWEQGKGVLAKAAELLDLPGIPKFSVKWNAQGGIFDRPTVLPTLEGWQGFGESGAEAITPVETLLEYVREAVKAENEPIMYYMKQIMSILAEYMPQLAEKDQQILLDGDALVGRLSSKIDQELGIISNRRSRGNI